VVERRHCLGDEVDIGVPGDAECFLLSPDADAETAATFRQDVDDGSMFGGSIVPLLPMPWASDHPSVRKVLPVPREPNRSTNPPCG
jgi:hypothetical protein